MPEIASDGIQDSESTEDSRRITTTFRGRQMQSALAARRRVTHDRGERCVQFLPPPGVRGLVP